MFSWLLGSRLVGSMATGESEPGCPSQHDLGSCLEEISNESNLSQAAFGKATSSPALCRAAGSPLCAPQDQLAARTTLALTPGPGVGDAPALCRQDSAAIPSPGWARHSQRTPGLGLHLPSLPSHRCKLPNVCPSVTGSGQGLSPGSHMSDSSPCTRGQCWGYHPKSSGS